MKKSVLIVDDDVSYLEALSSLVELVGSVTCATCDNGHDALNELKNRDFDAVFLDLVMPEIGGMQILKEVQVQGIKCKIFVFSAHLNDDLILQCKQYGAHEVMEKPIEPSKLKFILKSVI